MEEMNGTELKEFHLVLITLACQTWTLSCVFDRVPFPTSTLQATLTSFNTRLKKMSAFLLINKSLLELKSEVLGSLYRQKVYDPSQYSLARARLGEICCLFTPLYALCFALNDYNGTGGTGRKKDPCYWTAGHNSMEVSPADERISDVFLGIVAESEIQILNILSEFHFFTERMSLCYPNFSPPLKATSSDMVGVTPSTQVSECLVRVLQRDGRFFGGDVHFGTDPNRIVTTKYWAWAGAGRKLRVPNIMTMRLQQISKPDLELFGKDAMILRNLDKICHVIICLAVIVEPGTAENASADGILLFSDELRVSIDYARLKVKTVCLFENCLVFARQKDLELIIVHRVFLSDLLQVRYRPEHPGKGNGVLTIYWREPQPSNEWKVSGARIFFNELAVLKIWAAFLAINASTEPGIVTPLPRYNIGWNILKLPDRTTVRDMVALLPEIELACWGDIGEDTRMWCPDPGPWETQQYSSKTDTSIDN